MSDTDDAVLPTARSRWLAARARNLAHRIGALVTVGGITFAVVFGLLLWFTRAEREALQRIPVTADTIAVARSAAAALRVRRQADSALATVPVPVRRAAPRAVRLTDSSGVPLVVGAVDSAVTGTNIAATAGTPVDATTIPAGTAAGMSVAVAADTASAAVLPDSVRRAIAALTARLQRAQNAPLAASWRTLAADPMLQQDARVRALADSLAEAERARNEYDAVGGVDPIYLELSSRVTAYGRAIERSAQARISELERAPAGVTQATAAPLGPTPEALMRRYASDSARYAQLFRDRQAAARIADSVAAVLAASRTAATRRDASRARAQRRVDALAPPTAMVSASLAAALGIALLATLLLEIGAPRLADEHEVVSQARVPVLLHVHAIDALTPDALTSAFSQLVFDLGSSLHETRTLIVVSDDAALATRTGTRIAERLGYEGRRVRVVASSPSPERVAVGATPRVRRGRATQAPAPSVLVEPERNRGLSWTGEFARDALPDDTITVRAGSVDDVRPALTSADGGIHVILVVRTGSTPTAWLERTRAEIHRTSGTAALGVVIWAPDIDDVDAVTYAFDSARVAQRRRLPAPAE